MCFTYEMSKWMLVLLCVPVTLNQPGMDQLTVVFLVHVLH